MGGGNSLFLSALIEFLYLSGRPREEVIEARARLEAGPPVDPRYAAEIAPARSLADHFGQACNGRCQARLHELDEAEASGATYVATSAA